MMQRRFSRFVTIAAATVLLAVAFPAQAQQADAGSGNAGSRVYATNCVVCHQAGGTGMTGAFPPLAGHVPELLKRADGRSYIGKVLLFGLEGEINVNGNVFAGQMPPWNALGDDEIAAVINYVSNAWDNGKSLPSGFKPFTSDEIKALRTPELTSAQVYALRSGAAGGAPATATASGASGMAPVSFTADQVTRGSDIYAEPLNGKYFKQHWGGGSVAALVAFMKAKMPPDRPGSLTDQTYAELAAFLLDANDYPKGDKELPPDTASQQKLSLQRGK
jgi:mono/diheme cytochrome c family protein